jgi:hypothetical protein
MKLRNATVAVTVSLVTLVLACSKKDTSATATTSASTASGTCTLVKDTPRCQADGKAAFCRMNKAKKMSVEWQNFTCPDCKQEGDRVKCSTYTAGEPCDWTVGSGCNADGKSAYSCDMATETIKVTSCKCKAIPGGYSCG